ncbi:unnamed protein product [Lampetra fluviatilis]
MIPPALAPLPSSATAEQNKKTTESEAVDREPPPPRQDHWTGGIEADQSAPRPTPRRMAKQNRLDFEHSFPVAPAKTKSAAHLSARRRTTPKFHRTPHPSLPDPSPPPRNANLSAATACAAAVSGPDVGPGRRSPSGYVE